MPKQLILPATGACSKAGGVTPDVVVTHTRETLLRARCRSGCGCELDYDHVRCHPAPSSTRPLRESISCFGILEAIQIRKTNEHGRQKLHRGFGSEDARATEILETGGEDLGGRAMRRLPGRRGSVKGSSPGIDLEIECMVAGFKRTETTAFPGS